VTTGGIVLCGGGSRRLGRPKALLPFGPETMLKRVVRIVGEAAAPVVVVAAAGQELPDLPPGTLIARDRRPDRGPLEGIAVGLRALGDRVEAAFVTGCDAPLLLSAFVRRVIQLAAGFEVAVPAVGGRDEPLAAVYRVGVLPQAESLLAEDRLRPALFFDCVPTRRIAAEELADVDPTLQSLIGVNTPEQHLAALKRAGLAPPPDLQITDQP